MLLRWAFVCVRLLLRPRALGGFLCPRVVLELDIFWLVAQAFQKNSTESTPGSSSETRYVPLLGVTPKSDTLKKLEQLAQVCLERYTTVT